MSQILDGPELRLWDVITGGRGSGGELGTDPLARSIPAGRYRQVLQGAPLTDPQLPIATLDRAVQIEWTSTQGDPDPINEQDGQTLRIVRFVLLCGCVGGEPHTNALHLAEGEDPAAVVLRARRRALSDAERLCRALSFPGLFQDADDTVALVDLGREGATTLQDLGGGRLVSSTVYRLTLSYDASAIFDPQD